MAGPPAGFEDFLTQKYNIQKQEATNRGNLENAQAGAITGALGTENALRAAQANETNTRTSTLQPLAQSSIASTQAGIGETQARTGLYNTQSHVAGLDLYPVNDTIAHVFHAGMTNANSAFRPQTDDGSQPVTTQNNVSILDHFKAGTEKVPGKGTGKVDTVPAMLAPGEAVLNKGAAEHMGRGNIKQLNQIGLAKMGSGVGGKGMPAPKGVQKHAQGTDMVPASKVAPAPGQMITSGTWGETPPPPPQPTPGGFGKRLVRPPGPVPGFAKGTSKVPSAFYTKKDAAPLKPQALAKGTHNVMPGKSPTTPKAGPKGLANVLAAMQNVQPQSGGGMPGAMPMATAPGPRTA